MSSLVGAMGGQFKKLAIKATGCLLAVICFPMVIFGLVSGNWKAVGISIGVTCAAVIIAFKLIERRLKKTFLGAVPQERISQRAPPAAGPLDPPQRRQRIDCLLAAARFPRLAEIEPLFPKESEPDLLAD
jgi:hypothetical protein